MANRRTGEILTAMVSWQGTGGCDQGLSSAGRQDSLEARKLSLRGKPRTPHTWGEPRTPHTWNPCIFMTTDMTSDPGVRGVHSWVLQGRMQEGQALSSASLGSLLCTVEVRTSHTGFSTGTPRCCHSPSSELLKIRPVAAGC